jgi:hypothetical protein
MTRTLRRALLLAALATPASAGTLVGTVVVRDTLPPDRRVRASDAVVWVERIPERTERNLARGPKVGWFGKRTPPPLPVLTLSNQRFSPAVVAAAAGQGVVIRNLDQVWHGVFSVAPAARVDLGKRPPGAVDTLRITTPGVVPLRCDLHPDESAFLVVTPNHALARPDPDGHWQLPPLPTGRYVVRAWAPLREPKRLEIQVPRRGEVTTSFRW